jgi:HEAT repeat protein
LLAGLGSSDPAIREMSVWALNRCRFSSPQVKDGVFSLRDDPNGFVRDAVLAFASHFPADDRAVAIIRDAILSKSDEQCRLGLYAASRNHLEGAVFQNAIRRALHDHRPSGDWTESAVALAKVGGDPVEATAPLLDVLRSTKSEGSGLRGGALQQLGRIGLASTDVLGAIRPLLSDSDPELRCQAALAYAILGHHEEGTGVLQVSWTEAWKGTPNIDLWWLSDRGCLGVQAICESLRSERPSERKEAAEVLGRDGAFASAALPELRERRHDPDATVAAAAAEAVDRIEWELRNPEEAARLRAERTVW